MQIYRESTPFPRKRDLEGDIWVYDNKNKLGMRGRDIVRIASTLFELLTCSYRRYPAYCSKYAAALEVAYDLLLLNNLPTEIGNVQGHAVDFVIWVHNRLKSTFEKDRNAMDKAMTPARARELLAHIGYDAKRLRSFGVDSYFCQGPFIPNIQQISGLLRLVPDVSFGMVEDTLTRLLRTTRLSNVPERDHLLRVADAVIALATSSPRQDEFRVEALGLLYAEFGRTLLEASVAPDPEFRYSENRLRAKICGNLFVGHGRMFTRVARVRQGKFLLTAGNPVPES